MTQTTAQKTLLAATRKHQKAVAAFNAAAAAHAADFDDEAAAKKYLRAEKAKIVTADKVATAQAAVSAKRLRPDGPLPSSR